MISYHRDPHGENIMKNMTGTHCAKLQNSGVIQVKSAEQEKIDMLERRVSELEGELSRYKVNLASS